MISSPSPTSCNVATHRIFPNLEIEESTQFPEKKRFVKHPNMHRSCFFVPFILILHLAHLGFMTILMLILIFQLIDILSCLPWVVACVKFSIWLKTVANLQQNESLTMAILDKGPFIYYVIHFGGLGSPPPPYVIL